MMHKNAPSKNTPLIENKVIILGLPSLQNSILSGHIQNKIDIKSRMETQIRWRKEWLQKRTKTLILINAELCAEPYRERFNKFMNDAHQQHGNFILAFFGMQSMSPAEEYVSWPKVNGMFYQHDKQQKFTKGVQALFNGELWLPRHLLAHYLKLSRRCPEPNFKVELEGSLTPREAEILQLVAAGADNKEISRQLHISPQTIKSHLYNLYKKIHVRNRVQAVNWAFDNVQDFNTPPPL